MFEKLKIHDGDTPGKVFEVKLEYPKKETTMSDMKCPFCKRTLQPIGNIDTKYPTTNYYCPNNCIAFAFGNLPMWNELKQVYDRNKDLSDKIGKLETELERTRKALDKAKWWLNEIVENHRYTPISTAEMALKEITALEQKDVK